MEYKLIRFMQKKIFKAKNSFAPKSAPTIRIVDGLYTFYNDIRYDSKYPNNFLDIYIGKDNTSKKNRTLIFVHGGGFVWGDKSEYAPNPKKLGSDWYFKCFLKAGYDIVCLNYAFAPEYIYPTPVLQLDDAVRFLLQEYNKWNLNMDQLIFAGNSAGANIAGQYVNVQTNKVYAKELKLAPVLKPGQIQAVIFNSGLLDCERFADTGDKSTNDLFAKCGNTYFNCTMLHGDKNAVQSDVIDHATTNFPPTFISDGNHATFTEQAEDMAKRLEYLGIRHQLNIYDRSERKLRHDFERNNDKYGQDNMKKMLAFLKTEN